MTSGTSRPGPASPLTYLGINYDTGTNYMPGWHSRPDWSDQTMTEQLSVIRDQLHCNAVNVFGSELGHLAACAAAAVEAGLQVWVQPRLVDATPEALLEHLAALASEIEPLRAGGAPIRLNVGCELSVFAAGIMPGANYAKRARRLRWTWPLLPVFNRRLDALLGKASAVAREHFGGEITYGAGMWETVDWRRFDTVGLNHYRDSTNQRSYGATLEQAKTHGKPVLVTEFGCCGYPGADERGADGDGIVDWTDPERPRVESGHRRDEQVQAHYLGELLDTFATAGVGGAFVFEFSEPSYPTAAEPEHDLDMASFGVMAVHVRDTEDGVSYTNVPKAAFHEIARRYGETSRHRAG